MFQRSGLGGCAGGSQLDLPNVCSTVPPFPQVDMYMCTHAYLEAFTTMYSTCVYIHTLMHADKISEVVRLASSYKLQQLVSSREDKVGCRVNQVDLTYLSGWGQQGPGCRSSMCLSFSTKGITQKTGLSSRLKCVCGCVLATIVSPSTFAIRRKPVC